MSGAGTGISGIERTRLPSGLRVLTESMPELRSVAIGFWVGTGAVDEADAPARREPLPRAPALQGHRRPQRGGDRARDRVGRRRHERLHHPGVHGVLRAGARRPPRGRARHPLRRSCGTRRSGPTRSTPSVRSSSKRSGCATTRPTTSCTSCSPPRCTRSHPLGRSVLGTPRDHRRDAERDAIAEYHAAHYRPEQRRRRRGRATSTHDEMVELIVRGARAGDGARPARESSRRSRRRSASPASAARPSRPTSCSACAALARDDPDRYALLGREPGARRRDVVAAVPGGPRAARSRVLRVLVPGRVSSGTGVLGVYAGTEPGARRTRRSPVIRGELDRLVADGVPEAELAAAKGHLKGSTRSRSRPARAGCTASAAASSRPERCPSVDELVAEIEAVTVDDAAPGDRPRVRRRRAGPRGRRPVRRRRSPRRRRRVDLGGSASSAAPLAPPLGRLRSHLRAVNPTRARRVAGVPRCGLGSGDVAS